MHGRLHQGVWGYNVPGTFAACAPQGIQRNSHLTSALGHSASCFPLSRNYLVVLLTDDDDDDDSDVDE